MTSTEQHRQRVTVVSPFGQHQVDLPVDVPAAGLLPDLLAVAGLHPSQVQVGREGWRLTDAHGNAVPPAQTLAGHGIAPGEVIQLSGVHDLSPGPGSGLLSRQVPRAPMASAPPDDDLTPLQRTQAVLPARVGLPRRLLSTAGAWLQGPDSLSRAGAAPAQFAAHDTELHPRREPGSGLDGPATGEVTHPWPGQSGRHRLLPADLTVATKLSRADCGRAQWRALDNLGQLDSLIAGPRLRHCATIAVVSPKGGVGKTTVAALLGTLFSLIRRDPTVAVDTNPDFGSLGRVLTPDQSWYVDDLARLVVRDDELSLTALESQLGRAIHGLLVVPAPTDPARMANLDEDAYRRVITRLKDFFSLILLDCGTGLQDPASAAAVAAADQVVLLTDAQPATASLVAQSTDLLQQSGRPITVVVNRMPPKGGRLDLERLSHYLPAARGLVVIPDQVAAATRLAGGGFDWRDAPASWQLALRQLAVVLVSDWRRLGLTQ